MNYLKSRTDYFSQVKRSCLLKSEHAYQWFFVLFYVLIQCCLIILLWLSLCLKMYISSCYYFTLYYVCRLLFLGWKLLASLLLTGWKEAVIHTSAGFTTKFNIWGNRSKNEISNIIIKEKSLTCKYNVPDNGTISLPALRIRTFLDPCLPGTLCLGGWGCNLWDAPINNNLNIRKWFITQYIQTTMLLKLARSISVNWLCTVKIPNNEGISAMELLTSINCKKNVSSYIMFSWIKEF